MGSAAEPNPWPVYFQFGGHEATDVACSNPQQLRAGVVL